MHVSAPEGSIEARLPERVNALKKKLEGEHVPLLQTEYLGDAVERLLACFPRDQTSPQPRSFVALVQATLSGKTRLVLELVYNMPHTPVILIRLLATSNATYNALLQHLANNAVYDDNLPFEERRDHCRRIMFKIRVFFFCYMRFTEYFLQAMGKERGQMDKWRVDSLRGLPEEGGLRLAFLPQTTLRKARNALLRARRVSYTPEVLQRHKFYHLHDLTVGEMLATIRHHIPGLEKLSLENTTQLERMLKRWTGRPGFFFEFMLPHLRKLKPETDDFQSIEANEQEARKLATEFIKLLIREYELRHPGIHLADVVEIGYARVKRYELDSQHIEAVISDPLVVEALLDDRNNAYLNADRHLQHEFGTNLAAFAEYAIALQLLQRHDTELGDLISEWCDGIVRAPTQVLRLLRSAKVCALTAGRMDDFKIPSAEFLRPDILQDKVILAKTGLCLPDILFTAQTDQVKTWGQRLPPDSFSEAIHSTSRDWFLKQKRKVQLDNHAHLQKL
ncbi:hypothetical protein QOT17_013793 [Balamuthia mandrillaris]